MTTNISQKVIKAEEKNFNLRCEWLKSIGCVQSYVHLKIAKNDVDSGKNAHFLLFFAIFKCTQSSAELTDFNDSHIKLKLFSSTLIAFLCNIYCHR